MRHYCGLDWQILKLTYRRGRLLYKGLKYRACLRSEATGARELSESAEEMGNNYRQGDQRLTITWKAENVLELVVCGIGCFKEKY